MRHRIRSLGGGGGGTVIINPGGGTNQYMVFGTLQPQSSAANNYAAGGLILDLSKSLSFISTLKIVRNAYSPGAAGANSRYEYILNDPAGGKAKIKFIENIVTQTSSINTITAASQPSGVTIQTVSGQTSSSEATHTHSTTHDHGSFTSGVNTFGGGQVALNTLGINLSAHTHTLDLPSLAGTSGAGTSHNHADNSLYTHLHVNNYTTLPPTSTELGNSTLQNQTWSFMATGVKV